MNELGNADMQEIGRWANNRVENSHLSFRRRVAIKLTAPSASLDDPERQVLNAGPLEQRIVQLRRGLEQNENKQMLSIRLRNLQSSVHFV